MQFVSGEWVTNPPVEQAKQQVQPPTKRMVAVLPFIEKEIEAVKSFLGRSNQLAGQIPRTLYLMPFKGIDPKEVRKVAETAFGQVGTILDSEGINSDWQGRQLMRSAAGPNSLFRQATWFFYLKKIGPWLWLEPDCWPMSDRWFYELEREYFEAAKPFLGVKMGLPSGDEYLNGVAIYPWNAVQYAPLLVQSSMWEQHPEMEVGFDIAGGHDVMDKAHITRKIQLVSHLARGNVSVRPETVLCHGRIDLSGGSANSNLPDRPISAVASQVDVTSAQKPFLDRYGVAGEPQTEVFEDAPHAAPCVPSHETPVQETLQKLEQDRESNYGVISQEIRRAVEDLAGLWDQQPHRKVMIVKELRKAKLVPKHFR